MNTRRSERSGALPRSVLARATAVALVLGLVLPVAPSFAQGGGPTVTNPATDSTSTFAPTMGEPVPTFPENGNYEIDSSGTRLPTTENTRDEPLDDVQEAITSLPGWVRTAAKVLGGPVGGLLGDLIGGRDGQRIGRQIGRNIEREVRNAEREQNRNSGTGPNVGTRVILVPIGNTGLFQRIILPTVAIPNVITPP